MGWLQKFLGLPQTEARSASPDGGISIADTQVIEKLLRDAGINVSVNPANAMSIATFFGCVRVISNLIASQPCKLHKELSGGGSDVEKNHPLYYLLKHSPNPRMSPFVAFRTALSNVITRGFAIIEIKRTLTGELSELIPHRSSTVQVSQDITTGWYFFTITNPNGSQYVLSEDDVIFLKDLSFDGTTGTSIIDWQANTIEIDLLASAFARKYYRNGTFMTGFLSNVQHAGDNEEGIKGFKKRFVESLNNGLGDFSVVKGDVKWNPVTRPPIESQQVELFDKSASDIAMMFGIPMALLGNTEKQTSWGTGVEQMFIGVTRTVLIPLAIQIEQEINYKCLTRSEVLSGLYTKFNFQALLRGSSKDFAEYVRILNNIGAMNEDEIRALDDKPPLPDKVGSRYWKNGSYIRMDLADKIFEAKQQQSSNGINGKKVPATELQ